MSTHNIPFSIYTCKKITLHYSKFAAKGFFLGTKERVRNSRGKRAISVRAIEVLLLKQWLTFLLYCGQFNLASLRVKD